MPELRCSFATRAGDIVFLLGRGAVVLRVGGHREEDKRQGNCVGGIGEVMWQACE